MSAGFRPAQITPAAIEDDPVLEVMQAWDIVVYTDGDWSAAGMDVKLPTGFAFYDHSVGGNTKPHPLAVQTFPSLEFDTYVTAPSDTGASGAPAILSGFPEAEPLSMSGNRLSVSWGNLQTDPPGTYPIARMTFRRGLLPDFAFGSNTSQSNPASTAFIGPLTPPSIRDLHWVPDADGAWHNADNWSGGVPGTTNPYALDHAYLDVGGPVVRTITHSEGDHTVTTLLSMEHLAISGGSLTVNAYARLSSGLTITGGTLAGKDVLRIDGELSLSGPGAINLIHGALINDYTGPSPLATIRDHVISGHNAGSWDGEGIHSSTAATDDTLAVGYAEAAELFNEFPAYFIGDQIDESTILVRLTPYGDANLDEVVNLADFNRLAANFGASGALWSDGDFNYDGLVNLADFNKLAANFGLTADPDGPTPQDWAALAAAVPEPSMIGILPLAGVAVRRRSRR